MATLWGELKLIYLCGGIKRYILKNSKGKFELDKAMVKKMLQSDEVMKIAIKEAQKKGEITEEYVGTQRVWVKGRE